MTIYQVLIRSKECHGIIEDCGYFICRHLADEEVAQQRQNLNPEWYIQTMPIRVKTD